MKKYCLFLFLSFLILGTAGLAKADSSVIGKSTASRFNSVSFDNLKNYNIMLTGMENGISTYSGLKDGLRLNFTADGEQVTKIVYMFDNDIPTGDRRLRIDEIIDVTDNLLPGKIKSPTKAGEKLYGKINSLKGDRDTDVFTLSRLRVELNLGNHILNIRITP